MKNDVTHTHSHTHTLPSWIFLSENVRYAIFIFLCQKKNHLYYYYYYLLIISENVSPTTHTHTHVRIETWHESTRVFARVFLTRNKPFHFFFNLRNSTTFRLRENSTFPPPPPFRKNNRTMHTMITLSTIKREREREKITLDKKKKWKFCHFVNKKLSACVRECVVHLRIKVNRGTRRFSSLIRVQMF